MVDMNEVISNNIIDFFKTTEGKSNDFAKHFGVSKQVMNKMISSASSQCYSTTSNRRVF